MDTELDSVNDLQKLCRLCMESGLELYSIYDLTPLNEIGIHIQFVEMITGCTSLKIKSGDGLPEAICMQCVNYLGSAYNFKQRCEKTDRKLRELVNILKDTKKSLVEAQVESNFNVTAPLEQFDIKDDIKEETFCVQDSKINSKNLDNDSVSSKVKNKVKRCQKSPVDAHEKSTNKQILNSSTDTEDQHFYKQDIHQKTKNKGQKKDKSQLKTNIDTIVKNLDCSFCFKQFSSEINLKLHANACQIRTIHCGLCSKDFSNTNVLKEHLSQIHSIESNCNENQIYTCDICDSIFTDNNKLLFHYKNHISVAAYYPNEANDHLLICGHCNTHFTKVFDLENHINNHKSDDYKFVCRLCDYETTEDQPVKNHLKSHGLSPLVCNLCLLSFISNRKFRLHLRTHKQINKLSYTCLLCDENFEARPEIKNHITIHLKELHTCTTCSKAFLNVSEYESHQMEHAKSILCTICGKLFPGKSVLESHMLLHDGLKPFSCSVCKQSFRTKHILKGHERVHSDVKPYVCTWCGYACKRSGDLYIHHRIHTGDRPYSCSFPGCKSTFKTSSFMNQHLKRHTGQGKAHTCEVCTKIFSSSIALKRHMLIHTNERPHECDICGKCFRRKHHLKGHKTKIHHQ